MCNLKKMIVGYMRRVALIMVLVILLLSIAIHLLNEQRQAREGANIVFKQISHILNENNKEVVEIEAEYRDICLKNAESIAYIIQYHPEAVDSVEELKKIAEFTEVDEIHIFNKDGVIVTGTHPEYYGYSFDSGEQIGFFKPMLEDKELKLCQDIAPNTAEGKMMQYSALWSENKEFIVQVGMEPANVMKIREKNELSYIFSMLRVNPGITFTAIDKETGVIVGSTDGTNLGKHYSEIGLDMDKIENKKDGFHATVKGVKAYCIFKEMNGVYIGRLVPISSLYSRIPSNVLWMVVCLSIIAIILVYSVSKYVNKYVIDDIHNVNEKLRYISKGNLDENIDIQSSIEFSELSSHINEMVSSILTSNEKMSYVLDRNNIHIGIYEYNKNTGSVHFTKYITNLLALSPKDADELASDYKLFKCHMDRLCEKSIADENGVYLIEGDEEVYIKVEETVRNNQILGIVTDVTDLITKQRQIETERDIDVLTDLYSRRGLEIRLSELFKNYKLLGYGSIIVIDADGLKSINDEYGHKSGDIYLKAVADIFSVFDSNKCIASRQGGDEFVVFLYDYKTEELLLKDIELLRALQDSRTVAIDGDIEVALKFSMGYSMTKGESDYEILLKQADENMYADKMKRKKQL